MTWRNFIAEFLRFGDTVHSSGQVLKGATQRQIEELDCVPDLFEKNPYNWTYMADYWPELGVRVLFRSPTTHVFVGWLEKDPDFGVGITDAEGTMLDLDNFEWCPIPV